MTETTSVHLHSRDRAHQAKLLSGGERLSPMGFLEAMGVDVNSRCQRPCKDMMQFMLDR